MLRNQIWSGRPASNRLPQPWEGCALPGELRPLVRLQILGFFDDALGFRCGLRNNRSHQRRIRPGAAGAFRRRAARARPRVADRRLPPGIEILLGGRASDRRPDHPRPATSELRSAGCFWAIGKTPASEIEKLRRRCGEASPHIPASRFLRSLGTGGAFEAKVRAPVGEDANPSARRGGLGASAAERRGAEHLFDLGHGVG